MESLYKTLYGGHQMRKLGLSLLLTLVSLVAMAATVFADGAPSGWK
jgi:hypothetical protein